jgi:hypothetical protein
MSKKISREARAELLDALRHRYQLGSRKTKTRILDEFVAVAKCHRKHAIRLLGSSVPTQVKVHTVGRRIYDEAVLEALIVVWEAADRICGKRLKVVLPSFIDAMERHGHLELDSDVRGRLHAISPSSIDRLLAPIRQKARSRRKRRSRKRATKAVTVRTFADWNEPALGFFEIDFVAHCGGSMAGAFIHTFVATDVCSGWTEAVPLLAREQSLVVEALEVIRRRLPFPMRGVDSDNDGAFINDTLLEYCSRQELEFTRSRPYQSNDQAWVEQKNGAVIRRFVGHDRFSGTAAGQTLAHLYSGVRLFVNFFQPSFKLIEKTREGSKIKRRYDKPTTPCDRVLAQDEVDEETKSELRHQRTPLDPVALLHQIRDAQGALAALGAPDASGPGRESLEQFLAQLPRLWREGEARPTHRRQTAQPRNWRTREDPFAGVWSDVLTWLEDDPDATAKCIFERLRSRHPDRFPDGQLRTLQRRVKEWRHIMAKKLVYTCVEVDDRLAKDLAVAAIAPPRSLGPQASSTDTKQCSQPQTPCEKDSREDSI